MASPRVVRLADQIKVIVAEMLERRIKDPRLGFVTVTDVRLTGDTHDATVFYTVLGSDAERAETAVALRSANGLIRSQVGKQLGLKFTPTIEFVPDAVPENARQIEDLLAQARSVDARVAEQAAGAAYAGERRPVQARSDDDEEPASLMTTILSPIVATDLACLLDKPAGWTSHQVVGRVRRLAGTRKVGHAGTLDPMATGVLIVGVEKATRLLGYLALSDKVYEATIRLGIGTITDDAEGEVVTTTGAADLGEAEIEAAMARLRGDILQVPAAVSAIKIDGVRSYRRVRAGQSVELSERPVTIRRFDLLGRRELEVDGVGCVDLSVVVECSSGTYIRALARDLGAALGVGGHLTSLRRTRVGAFTLDEAQTLEEAERGLRIMPLDRVVRSSFPTLTVNETQASQIRNGRRLAGVILPDGTTALLDEAGHFLALYRQEGPDAIAEAVFI